VVSSACGRSVGKVIAHELDRRGSITSRFKLICRTRRKQVAHDRLHLCNMTSNEGREMSGSCSTNEGDEKCVQNFS
jgi:hypothetical protein